MKRGLRLEELYQSFNQYNVHGDFNAAGSIKHLRQITRELARGSSNRNRGHVGGAARHNSHAGAASRVSWVAASRDLGRSRAAAGMRWVTSTGNFSWGRAAARVSRIAAQTSGNLSGSLGTASRMGWVATTRDLGGRRTFRCYCSVGSGEKKDGRQTSELHFDGRKRL